MSLRRNLTQLGPSSLHAVVGEPIDLASLDMEEAVLRVGALLAGALVTSLMLTLALAGAAATFVYFWERLAAASGVTAFFAVAAALMAWRVACALRGGARLPAAPLAGIDQDGPQRRSGP